MSYKDTFYIDDAFYYLVDPKESIFQFHHLLGLAFNYKDIDNIVKDLFYVLEHYGIYWFDEDKSDDAFFSDDPINTNNQDNVFLNIGKRKINYIADMASIMMKYNVQVFRSSDSRSFMEYNSMNINLINKHYDSEVDGIIFKYLGYVEKEEAKRNELHFLYTGKRIENQLHEFGLTPQVEEFKNEYIVLHVLLDFFHAYQNYYLKILAKNKKSKEDLEIFELHKAFYPEVIYDKYRKVRAVAKEITEQLLKNSKYFKK